MRLLFPQSLAGRLILWLLASLLIVQVGFMLFQEYDRRQDILRAVEKGTALQAVTIARILENVEPDKWPDALAKSSNEEAGLRVDVDRRFIELRVPKVIIRNNKTAEIGSQGMITIHSISSIKAKNTDDHIASDVHVAKNFPEVHIDQPVLRYSFFSTENPLGIPVSEIKGVSVKLVDGRWLNADISPNTIIAFKWQDFIPLMASAALLILVVIIVVNLETRSLRTLAQAADLLGRGEKLDNIRETGPHETRAALRAFNQMGDRIGRFVRDRTQMLAAMSHDLRTPLTSMRLRVEELEDKELREELINSIEEMKQMSEASLEFAKADAVDEPGLQTDLTDLANNVAADFLEIGETVEIVSLEPVMAFVRPLAFKRAMRNLVENAVRYGEVANIKVSQTQTQILFEVSDNGPGIAEADLKRVFEPFTRLETSRNRQTGGAGLGLAIARSIVNSHGGELVLENLKQGGLSAKIILQQNS